MTLTVSDNSGNKLDFYLKHLSAQSKLGNLVSRNGTICRFVLMAMNACERTLFFAVTILLSACSNPFLIEQPTESPGYKNKVVYEAALSDGHLHTSQILEDPYQADYSERAPLHKLSGLNVTTIGRGPEQNRINIVFLGDGYGRDDLPKYRAQVDAIIHRFLAASPMNRFQNHFLFHRIELESEKSGISDSSKNKDVSTPLRMLRGCHGIERLICIDVQQAQLAASAAPKVDLIFALANTADYGGAGYRDPAIATFAGGNSDSFELALHEFGHSFADLADEYEDPGSDPKTCELKSNASVFDATTLLRHKHKWFRWLDLPEVDAFRGACYGSIAYRPTFNSKMRTLGRPFDVVSSEQIILKIYQKLKPLDGYTPEGKYLARGRVYAQPIPSNTGELRWFLNGKEADHLLNMTVVELKDLDLRTGKNRLEARFTERSAQVRDEESRQALMTQNLKWTLQKLK